MLPRPLRRAIALLLVGSAALAPACASRGPDLAARMASARTTAESFGYQPFGPALSGTLEGAKEQRFPLALKDGCYQIFAFGGDGLSSIDLSLLDPAGKAVGTATKADGQSSLKHCITDAGTYSLVAKSGGGTGAFVAQPYSSSAAAPVTSGKPTIVPDDPACTGPDCDDTPSASGVDDCGSGTELTVGGSLHGTTAGKGGMNTHWNCAASDGPGAIYRIHVDGRHKLVLDLTAKFDAVVSLTRASTSDGYLCDSMNEVECSDDAEGMTNKAHIEAVVDTGDYGVLVGGFDGDHGEFDLKTRFEEAPSLDAVCATAQPITAATKVVGVVGMGGSSFRATCSNTDGDEALFKLDLAAKSRLRVQSKATSGEVTLSMRGRCEDPTTEVACSRTWHFDGVSWTGSMLAGQYTIIADVFDQGKAGTVDVSLDTAPETGGGLADGDTCKDPRSLAPVTGMLVDTFKAKGDARVSCAADAAADVVYKIDVKSKSRLTVSSTEDEGQHVVAVQKACGDPKEEVACALVAQSGGVDVTVVPGTYYVVLKGKSANDFGRVRLDVKLRDLGAGLAACKAATKIKSGDSLSDSTVGQPDRFASPGCGGILSMQGSGDRVYQFTLKDRSHVNFALKNTSFYGAIMSLRKDCSDPTKDELACSYTYNKTIDRDLDAGTYYLVVDGNGSKSEGNYTLEMTAKSIK